MGRQLLSKCVRNWSNSFPEHAQSSTTPQILPDGENRILQMMNSFLIDANRDGTSNSERSENIFVLNAIDSEISSHHVCTSFKVFLSQLRQLRFPEHLFYRV